MDLNEIYIFNQVVEAGSFTAAARDLDMPKSTVSRKVAELEDRLGTRLLHRTTRRLHLTDAGRTFHSYAARAVAEVDAAERAIAASTEVPRGPLRVSAPVGMSFLGPLCAKFTKRCPEVELELVCSDRVVDLIDEGFDLAIRVGPLADSSLIARRLTSWRSLLVASRGYLKRRKKPATPGDLEAHDCIVFGTSSQQRKWRLQVGRTATEVSVRGRVMTNDLDAIDDAVRSGVGVALMPPWRCAAELRDRRLVRVLPDATGPEVSLYAVYPSRRHVSPNVREFVEGVVRELEGVAWG